MVPHNLCDSSARVPIGSRRFPTNNPINASARRLRPICLRPRPPSIQFTPQFRIGVFRKSCPHAESDGIVPQPATFAAGRSLAFRSCADDHVRCPPRGQLRCVAARRPSFPNRRSIARHFLSRPTFDRKQSFGITPNGYYQPRCCPQRQHSSYCSAERNCRSETARWTRDWGICRRDEGTGKKRSELEITTLAAADGASHS